MAYITRLLFKPIDIASLVFFRLLFGILIIAEAISLLWIDWVSEAVTQANMQFRYYGFEWVAPLPPVYMYGLLIILGVAGLGVFLGLFYRICSVLIFLGSTYIFLIDKSFYLNHGYFFCLLGFFLIVMPAHKALSLDSLRKPNIRVDHIPYWPLFLLQFQMGLVYFFGGIAKINVDWLNGLPLKIWLEYKKNMPIIGDLISQDWFAYAMSYGGLVFDLFIVFFFLNKRTRFFALFFAFSFHVINTILFKIGIFPWLSLGLSLLYFSPDWPRKLVVKRFSWANYKTGLNKVSIPKRKQTFIASLIVVYCAVQLLLPLRHHLYEGNVAWTEEGHRFSWRMMLRSKSAYSSFKVIDPISCKNWVEHPHKHLTKRQYRKMKTHPIMLVQFANYLEKVYQEKGYKEVEVYVTARAGLNGRKRQLFIDTERDLTTIEINPFKKADWIIPLEK